MSGLVPPVIDPSRARVQEAVAHSPFNIFNIIAIALIVGIGFYLYRKFLKTPQRRFPLVQPVVPKAETAAPISTEEDEVPSPPAPEESKDE